MVHEKQKDHKCNVCGKAFYHKSNLSFHVTTVHLKQRNYKCEDCGKLFSQSGNLRKHVEKNHILIT